MQGIFVDVLLHARARDAPDTRIRSCSNGCACRTGINHIDFAKPLALSDSAKQAPASLGYGMKCTVYNEIEEVLNTSFRDKDGIRVIRQKLPE